MTIRNKLVLSVTIVIVAMVASVALASHRAADVSVERTSALIVGEERQVADAAARVVAASAGGVDLVDVRPALNGLGRWLLVSSEPAVVAASEAELVDARVVEDASGGLLVSFVHHHEGREESEELLLRPSDLTLDVHGHGTSALYLLPGAPVIPEGVVRELVASTNTWTLVTLLTVGLVGLASIVVWMRRLVAPVDALTLAVAAFERGDDDVQADENTGAPEIDALGRAFNDMVTTRAATDTLRRALVSDVAHELRSPLTNLRCQVDAVQDGVRPAEEALAILDTQLADLERLVGDLDALARADAGALDLELEVVDVSDAVHGFLAAEPTTADVTVDISDGAVVVADALRFRQVIGNVVRNADVYAASAIEVHVSTDDDVTLITVADDGPGVPREHRQRVFERFHRVDSSRTRSTGGSGLGLAIVRRLVLAHGGSVRLGEASNGGALVEIRWPRP